MGSWLAQVLGAVLAGILVWWITQGGRTLYAPSNNDSGSMGQSEKTKQGDKAQESRGEQSGENDDAISGAMVQVPAGEFWMGCSETNGGCSEIEKPRQRLLLVSFQIDRTEVTVVAYQRCVKAGKCTVPSTHHKSCNWSQPGREQYPINCVNWEQARTYCAWVGKRLPTEAEWEKTARGTDGRLYSWGNTWEQDSANTNGAEDAYKWTAPVSSFPRGTSPYGALDMIGNVWEWTADWYDRNHNYRSLRGGSWSNQQINSSYCYWNSPSLRAGDVGFRCVR